MIALRARREAVETVEPIAYPHLEAPPPLVAIPLDLPPEFRPPRPEPAPAWFRWVFLCSLIASTVTGFLLIKFLG